MSQVNDCKYNALSAVFGSGHINDLILKFLQANGATSNNINDAWSEVFGGGVTPPPENAIAYYDFTQFSPTSAITDKIGGEVVTTSRGSNLNVTQSDGVSVESFGFNQAGFDRGVGMLVESDSFNLSITNQTLASYSTINATITDTGDIAPDGVTTWQRLTATDTLQPRAETNTAVPSVDTVYTWSTFVRKGSNDFAALSTFDSNAFVIFNIANGTIDTESGNISASIEVLGDDVAFIQITFEVTAAESFNIVKLHQTEGSNISVGEIGGYVDYWGAQFEVQPQATSVIYTGNQGLVRPTTVATMPTSGWPTTEFRLTLEFIYLGENGVNARLFESVSPSNERILLERTSSGDQYIFIRKDTEQSAVGPVLTHNIGDKVKVVIECSSAGTTVTVNDISENTNPLFNATPWSDYPLRLFQSIFGDNLSTRALVETISIQSPIPAPPPTSILTVVSVVGGSDPKEVAYGNIGQPSDPQGSLVPTLLLDGEPFSLITQLINPFGKLVLLVNNSQNWTVGRTVVTSFDGVEYTFLPDVFGPGQDFNVTICQSTVLYEELYAKRDTDIDFSIISVTQPATPTLGTSSTGNQFNDGMYAFYKSQGAVGEQLNDLEKDFWCNVAQPQNAPLPWILSDNEGNVISDNSGTALRT